MNTISVTNKCMSTGDAEVLTCAVCGAPITVSKPLELCICLMCGVACWQCADYEHNDRLVKIVTARNWKRK